MLSSSLDTLLKVSKTTYHQKLFGYDCVTLYNLAHFSFNLHLFSTWIVFIEFTEIRCLLKAMVRKIMKTLAMLTDIQRIGLSY